MGKKKKPKRRGKLKQIMLSIGFVLLGMVCGTMIIFFGGVFDRETGEISLTAFIILFASIYIAMQLQIAVHEG